MGRAVLQACLPWLALLLVSCACAYLLVRVNRSRIELRRLRRLHRDQLGSAQTLSFVLTLPFFVMIMLFIVQVSQLMIGAIVVHYAAFAAARSAIVWIPAALNDAEWRNRISSYTEDPEGARRYFAELRTLRNLHGGADLLPQLSMGMSHDLEVAIAEGATTVRIGTALFGARAAGK